VAIFLGIDGGGSKTSCLIGDETSILGAGTASGSNPVRVGVEQARESLAAAIRQACAVANVSLSQLERTCVGLAGAVRPEISDPVREFLSQLIPGEIEIVGDMVIALEAAFGGASGVIVIAGTGSIAYGRNSAGQTARAGGWGFAISDEGSGHWIGRTAVAAAVRAVDESDPESGNQTLLESLMSIWRVKTREGLVVAANSTPPPDFSALFPAVLAAADRGDPVALRVMGAAGTELAGLAETVVERLLSPTYADARPVSVAMSGGVFGNSPLVRQIFHNRLRSEYPEAVVNPDVIEPVRGALELARKNHLK
jgi:N-acetylglucosamine kinase-like BadF-type ATPase